MEIEKEHIIGELVANDYRTASVFKSFGIDFCCKGNRSIHDACEGSSINPDQLIEKLNQAVATGDGKENDFQSWDLDLLIDYILKKHHRFVENKIQEITPFLNKVATKHGGRHPELIEIEKLFMGATIDLAAHMQKEEMILFPFIEKMVASKSNNQFLGAPHFGTVENPVGMMRHEHDAEGDRFRRIAELSNNYTPPEDACNTYRVSFALLQEFEEDLHKHIHLENNILFPKAIELERELLDVV